MTLFNLVSLVFGILVVTCIAALVAARFRESMPIKQPSLAHRLDGLAVPSALDADWVYTRLYYAARDSLETGESMGQANVRTEDLVSALHGWRGRKL